MLVMTPDTIAIQRLLVGPKDQYGNVSKTWQVTATVKGHVLPEGSDETNTTQTVTRYLVLVPLGTVLKASDRISWSGMILEIDGAPSIYTDLPGMPGHIEAKAKVVVGGA
ncbi:head-tail adaptor protein [Streptomyces phaeochromogenes]|uniref:hypothetical protein n=1 Tax=Streptomyces phaeochromogenes TaxID=1923 RepID=UPI002E2AAA5F|nr:hypothetical protein [Streptomyces phaeochromogenes]